MVIVLLVPCVHRTRSIVVLWCGGAEKQKKGIEPFQKVSPEATLKSEKKRDRGGTNRNRNAQKRRE